MRQFEQMEKRTSLYVLFFLLIFLVVGCAKPVKIKVFKPAEINTNGIKRVVVGNFEVQGLNRIYRFERNGKWHTQKIEFSAVQKKELSKQVRARVVSLLSSTPYFELVVSDDLEALESDAKLQKTISFAGYKAPNIDAIVSGKIWLDLSNYDGVELAVAELAYTHGGSSNFDYTVEAVTFWPYKSVRGNLSLEMKLTGLNPTNIVAVTFDSRQFAHKLGGKPASLAEQIAAISTAAGTALSKSDEKGDKKNKLEDSDLVLPNFTQIVSDMAESIAAKFVRRIAVTQQRVAYSIASGGDATAKLLIEAGAYKTAIKMLNKNAKKKAADLYNLGLCYEAIGEFGVAKIHYEDALGKAKKNLMFAQGVGRIERLKRESRIVREQLASKK